MRALKTLFKKQLIEYFTSFKRTKQNKNILGAIMFILLISVACVAIIPVLSTFIDKYLYIRINNVLDIKARQFELTTIIYAFMFIFSLISAVSKLQHVLFEDDDRLIYTTLPLHPAAIFVSKISFVYVKEAIICIIATLPIIILFAIKAKLTVYYVLSSMFVGAVLPIITTSIASVLCIPVYYIKKLFQSQYFVMLIITTLIIGAAFFAYTKILDFASTMVATGEMRFFFSEKVMNAICSFTRHAYPSNFCAHIVLKQNILRNLAQITLIVILFSALGLLVVSLAYSKTIQLKQRSIHIHHNKTYTKLWKYKNPYLDLINKEFINILRTPSYALEYFAVAILAPLMVYSCMDIGKDLLTSLVFVERNFELSLLIVLIFTSLTNTFSSTSISRDGNSFFIIKTLPVLARHIVGSKVLFSSIVMFFAVLLSIIVITVMKYVSILEALYIFVIAIALGFAQICFAIKRDLLHPRFPKDSSNEVTESNTTVSVIILVGLLVSIIVGGIPLISSTLSTIAGKYSSIFSYVFPIVIALLTLVISILYLHKDADKLFDEAGGN